MSVWKNILLGGLPDFMELRPIHARYAGTHENLCGKMGLSLERWSETAEEITCPDCQSKIPTFTSEELNAGIAPALRQLARELRGARKE
jgi:hypothetical protein